MCVEPQVSVAETTHLYYTIEMDKAIGTVHSHVRASHPLIDIQVPNVQNVLFDKQNNALVIVTSDGLMQNYPINDDEATAASHTIEDRFQAVQKRSMFRPGTLFIGTAPVHCVRFNFDLTMVALQRSHSDAQIIILESEKAIDSTATAYSNDIDEPLVPSGPSHEVWLNTKRNKLDTIYEMFWTTTHESMVTTRAQQQSQNVGKEEGSDIVHSSSNNNVLVLATAGGIEVIEIDKEQCHTETVLEKKRNQGTRWCHYEAETGLLLMASGQYCSRFTIFSFPHSRCMDWNSYLEKRRQRGTRSSTNIIHKVVQFELPAPILLGDTIKKHDVSLLVVGGFIYVAHHQHLNSSYSSYSTNPPDAIPMGNDEASLLVLYRLHDTSYTQRLYPASNLKLLPDKEYKVTRSHILRLYSLSSVQCCVLDGVIAVYSVDNKVCVLYDIGASNCKGQNSHEHLERVELWTNSGYSSRRKDFDCNISIGNGGDMYVEPMLAPLPIGTTAKKAKSKRATTNLNIRSNRTEADHVHHLQTKEIKDAIDRNKEAEETFDEHRRHQESRPYQDFFAPNYALYVSLPDSSDTNFSISLFKLRLDLDGIVNTSVLDLVTAARADVVDFLLRRSDSDYNKNGDNGNIDNFDYHNNNTDNNNNGDYSAPIRLTLQLLSAFVNEDKRIDVAANLMDVIALNILKPCFASIVTNHDITKSDSDVCSSRGSCIMENRDEDSYHQLIVDDTLALLINTSSDVASTKYADKRSYVKNKANIMNRANKKDTLQLSDLISHVLLPAMLNHDKVVTVDGDTSNATLVDQAFVLYCIQELKRSLYEIVDNLFLGSSPAHSIDSELGASVINATQTASPTSSVTSTSTSSSTLSSSPITTRRSTMTSPERSNTFISPTSAFASLTSYNFNHKKLDDHDYGTFLLHAIPFDALVKIIAVEALQQFQLYRMYGADVGARSGSCLGHGILAADLASIVGKLINHWTNLTSKRAPPTSSAAHSGSVNNRKIIQVGIRKMEKHRKDVFITSKSWPKVVTECIQMNCTSPAKSRIIAALNITRYHRINDIPVENYIEAVLYTYSHNPLIAVTLQRFCSAFVAGFDEHSKVLIRGERDNRQDEVEQGKSQESIMSSTDDTGRHYIQKRQAFEEDHYITMVQKLRRLSMV